MTLTVTAYRVVRDANGERLEEIADLPDLAGFEVTRHIFYAGPKALRLGLVLLPKLATEDLEVWGDDLAILRAELLTLLRHLADTDEDETYWRIRLGNILRAVDAAAVHGPDGVVMIG